LEHIQTRPPISKAEIDELVAKLASVKTKNIDGTVLSNLVRTCHECGLKKCELIDMSLEDVAVEGIVKENMQVRGSRSRSLRLSDNVKRFLQDHIDYLKGNEYQFEPDSRLFPNSKNKRYTAKTLDNHLKEAQNVEI
jgi:site-specific recombinase XerD